MVKPRKLHKTIGLASGLFLFILSVTGFFLDHDTYNFLWNVKLDSKYLPSAVKKKQFRNFEAYKINPVNPSIIITGSGNGIFISIDSGKTFDKTFNGEVFSIEPARFNFSENFDSLFIATDNGIFVSRNGGLNWKQLALENKLINSFCVYNNYIFAVSDKEEIYKVNIPTGESIKLSIKDIPVDELPKIISLNRFVRDLHYGRGLFNGKLSLYINDFAAMVLIFLVLSGFWFYFKFKQLKKKNKINKKYLKFFIKQHSSIIIVLTFVPVLFLLITGIILDHTDFFNSFLRRTKISTKYLPPVYRKLSGDIWGIDYDGKYFRIGNRLGVFKSTDLSNWKLDSEGFAYRIKRIEKDLYVSGMGSPNRLLKNNDWIILKNTVRMPRDFFKFKGEIHYVNLRKNENLPVPKLKNVPLVLVLLALHDGTFFHSAWVFVNDIVALSAAVLFVTGFIRWKQSRKHKIKVFMKNHFNTRNNST